MKEKLIIESTPFSSSSLAPVHVHVHIVVIVIIVVVVVVIVRVADIYVADICEASPNKCEKKRLKYGDRLSVNHDVGHGRRQQGVQDAKKVDKHEEKGEDTES